MRILRCAIGVLLLGASMGTQPAPIYDVVIYGGTAAAMTAGVQTARMGKSVLIISPDTHLGGLSSGGLGFTDTGDKSVIGGLARDFYHRVWQHYDHDAGWVWEPRSAFGNRGQGTSAIDGDARTMWIFEPHVAESVFEDVVRESHLTVWRNQWLDREHGVMTEHELLKERPTPDPIGMGSYGIDSHNAQRYITPDGFVQNEGDLGVSTNGPYTIAYGSIVPRAEESTNLLVPVAVSSSHVAFGSIRMEPVFMILGQSAATAAALALDRNTSVQAVPYGDLRARLIADGQVLTRPQ